MLLARRNRLKPTGCTSKLSTITGQHPQSANTSKHHYSSSMFNLHNQSKRILACRRSVGPRMSHTGKENQSRNFRMSPSQAKGGSLEYEYIMEVGQGTFGKVWKVKHRETGVVYALKAMLKVKIIAKKSVESVMNERMILSKLRNCKFIVNAIQSFQDNDYLYLLMEYMPRGDLRYIIYYKSKLFQEEQAKFLICCLICAVRFLHKNQVIHRDIKPENLVLDHKGYLRLTDMGISKVSTSPVRCDGSGTPAYMAPESFETGIQSFCNDYYAIGVIAYELLNGKRPYVSKVRQELYQQMQERKKLKYEERVPLEAKLFCQGLLNFEPSKRLGAKNGIADLENHVWFQDVDWMEFRKKKYKSPFNYKHNDRDMVEYQKLLGASGGEDERFSVKAKIKAQFQFLFKNYNYNF